MSTLDGFKRRLGAAARALKGDYIMAPDGKSLVAILEEREHPAADDTLINDKDTVEALNPKYCTGCGACANACPKDAITMQENDEGFLMPVIDPEKCIHCGLCKKVCPAINHKDGSGNFKDPACKAVWASDEIRKVSSSGGMFTVLAEYIFDKGGYVCGAAYEKDNNFYLSHKVISGRDELPQLQGSKYLQSDVKLVYREIKGLLAKDKYVLFCGTPCQVAGLQRYLGKSYDKLITCDLVCHGVPPYRAFGKYLDDKYKKPIADFRFRQKETGYSCTTAIVDFKDGTHQTVCTANDTYERMFHSASIYRNSCYSCRFAVTPRYGDFTIGDFWGISQINKDFNDGKGTSLVLVNNKKAEKILEEVRDKLKLCEDAPLDIAKQYNSFGCERKRPKTRDRFFKLMEYNGYTFRRAEDYSKMGKYDVGVIGLWYGRNYGSMATYFALNQVLEKRFKKSVLMIDNPSAGHNEAQTNPRLVAKEFYNVSERYELCNLRYLNETCDAFIVGSDQLWNVSLSRPYGQMYFLDFVHDNHNKIAYGTSFAGPYKGKPGEKSISSKNLKRFSHVSVRDDISYQISTEEFGVENVAKVCDPAFLATLEDYQVLVNKSNVRETEDYILAYILDPNKEIGRQLENISQKKGKKVIVILDEYTPKWEENKAKLELSGKGNVEIKKDVSLYDWMWYYNHAKSVVTDSFHGTIYSIIFQKPFITVVNRKRGPLRFTSLLKPIALEYRLLEGEEQIENHLDKLDGIDYAEPNKKLDEIKDFSMKWLEDALAGGKS